MRSRITVLSTVYHQQEGSEPQRVESRFTRLLQTEEQPFRRVFRATEEWARVQAGWLSTASMIELMNDEGKFLEKNPTKEEREAMLARIVEIGVGSESGEVVAFSLVPPGESSRWVPGRLDKLFVRCRSGSARCTIYLFPE